MMVIVQRERVEAYSNVLNDSDTYKQNKKPPQDG